MMQLPLADKHMHIIIHMPIIKCAGSGYRPMASGLTKPSRDSRFRAIGPTLTGTCKRGRGVMLRVSRPTTNEIFVLGCVLTRVECGGQYSGIGLVDQRFVRASRFAQLGWSGSHVIKRCSTPTAGHAEHNRT